MKRVSRILEGLRTLSSWFRRNRIPKFPKVLLLSFPAFSLIPISLPSLAIPKELLMLQLIRIGGVFQLPDSFRSGKRSEKKPSAKNQANRISKPPEIIETPDSVARIELLDLQRLLESINVQPMTMRSLSVTPSASFAVGIQSRRNYPLEGVAWLRPFGLQEREEARRSPLVPHSSESETDKGQAAEYGSVGQESPGTEVMETGLEETSTDHYETPRVGSEDLAIISDLPIFLEWKGVGHFFGIHDTPLFLVPLGGVSVATELEPVTIPVPSAASPTRSVRRRVSSSSTSVREMQRSSAGRKSQYFESELEQPAAINHISTISTSHDRIVTSESKNYAVWTKNHSPISSLLDGSLGTTGIALARVPVPLMFPGRAEIARQSWTQIRDSPSKYDKISKLSPQFQDSKPRAATLRVSGQDHPPEKGGVESPMIEVDYASSPLYGYDIPLLIDIPLLMPYPALSILDWQSIAPITKRTRNLLPLPSMSTSPANVFGAHEKEKLVAANRDFQGLLTLELPSTPLIQLYGTSNIDILKDLLPMTSLALVRIGAIDPNSTVSRGISPFGSAQQSWTPGIKIMGRRGSTEFDVQAWPPKSFYLPPGTLERAHGQAENRSGFVQVCHHAESKHSASHIPVRSMQHESNPNIFESIPGDLSINNLMSAEPNIEERTEIPSTPLSLRKADLDVRSPGMTGKDDLDLEELRSIRRSVHITMKEQLRKYGFEA